MVLDFFFFFFFKAVCVLQEPRPFHLGLEHNCTGLINSSSFRSKVEAAAQGCKSNPNPLWAPILWTIKTKSSAAAVPAGHKTLGKHPERAAKQLAGWGTTRAETVRAGRRRRPCRWAGGGRQGSKSILKGGSWAAARRDSRGHARPAPGGNGALAKKPPNKTRLHGREPGCATRRRSGRERRGAQERENEKRKGREGADWESREKVGGRG